MLFDSIDLLALFGVYAGIILWLRKLLSKNQWVPSFPRKPQLTNEAFLIMGYNYAWLLSASYVDLSLTNAIFQLSVVRSPRSVVLLQHRDTDHMCGDSFIDHYKDFQLNNRYNGRDFFFRGSEVERKLLRHFFFSAIERESA